MSYTHPVDCSCHHCLPGSESTPARRTRELGEQAQAEFARQEAEKVRRLDALAERIACSMYGYFKGDSAGSASAMRYFENYKGHGECAHIIERVRSQLRAEFNL